MNPNQIARIAALVGEPARAAMLLAIMDGRALTARELSVAAGISPQTASRHLALMVEAGLMGSEKQGRHRYHRLASPEVARMLEGLMQLASSAPPPRQVVSGPRDSAMRMARMCYDHLAGRLGVAITGRLLEARAIAFDEEGGHVTPRAPDVLRGWGIEIPTLDAATASNRDTGARSRPWCRPCLDWSERRPHVAGRLGALLCAHYMDEGWLTRKAGGRALTATALGAARLQGILGLSTWDDVTRP